MTLKEFTQGWMLLTAQPWGKAYRMESSSHTGEPCPGEIQAEFYFQSVKAYPGRSWFRACQEYASGERWPSLGQLKETMGVLSSPFMLLAAPKQHGVSMEEALQERPDLLAVVKRVLS